MSRTDVQDTFESEGVTSNGTVPTENPVWMSGWDGVNKRAILTDPSGRPQVILNDAAGAGITSSLINGKQRLDTNLASEGQVGSPVPFQTTQVGGRDSSGLLQALSLGFLKELNVSIVDDQADGHVVLSQGQLLVADASRLLGDTQEGTTLDTDLWVSSLSGSGSITLANGMATLAPGVTANSSALLVSTKKARFITGAVNAFKAVLTLSDTGVLNNVRRWGVYDVSNGCFFQLNGTTVGIGIRKTGVDTVVTSFNGGNSFVLDTNLHSYEIRYTHVGVFFLQDNKLIHSVKSVANVLFDTPHLHIGVESTNSGGGTSNSTILLGDSAVMRYGEENARPLFKFLNSAGTTVLKKGPGTLHKVILGAGGSGNPTLTLYDSLTGSGTQITLMDLAGTSVTQGTYDFDLDFDTGLTAVFSGTSGNVTVVYD